MGEAKRRKKLDPNFGQPKPPKPEKIFAGKTESQWKEELKLPDNEWNEIKYHLRTANNRDEVDSEIDAVWIYTRDDGKKNISFTGNLANKSMRKLIGYS